VASGGGRGGGGGSGVGEWDENMARGVRKISASGGWLRPFKGGRERVGMA
jgi:hypothetical protein